MAITSDPPKRESTLAERGLDFRDADAVYARAQAAGATIIRQLQNTDYGSREFAVLDPEGHSWSCGTYDPWQPGH